MTKREGYSKRMEQKLNRWKQRFESERAAAQKLGAGVPAAERERLESAKVAGDAAFAKFAELRETAARWVALRVEMEKLWLTLDPSDEDAEAAPRARVGNA